jgi:hypothetical protein
MTSMSTIELQQMPRQEKLRLLESLWADLSQDDTKLESPAWHATVLAETERRLANGQEQALDWDQAKAQLRAPKA